MDNTNNGNLMYLPLDKLMSKSANSSMGSSNIPSSILTDGASNRNVLEEFNRNTSRSRVRETR